MIASMEHQFCTPPHVEGGEAVPTACVGANTTLIISGGYCWIHEDHSVTCRPPYVALLKNPAYCALHHRKPTTLVGGLTCKVAKHYGEAASGTLVRPANVSHVFDAASLALPQRRGAPIPDPLSGVAAHLHTLGKGMFARLSALHHSLPAHPLATFIHHLGRQS